MIIPINYLILSIVMAGTAGLVGCFALMKKMSLSSDALSHVALPGLGIALMLKINPLIGGATALIIGALIIWALENKTKISTETIIGVVFSASLAIGTLLTPESDLIDALFGSANYNLKNLELYIGLALALLVIGFIIKRKDALVLSLISPDLAKTTGVNVRSLNLSFLIIFSLTIILGLRYSGALLMGSLIIIPAATAKLLSRDLKSMLLISSLLAIIATVSGEYIALRFGLATGPIIIVIATLFFVLGLLFKKSVD